MCRVNFRNIPERSLEPPADRRQVFADCVVCEKPIKEFDDCLDLPNVGYVCMHCVDKYKRIEVTLD